MPILDKPNKPYWIKSSKNVRSRQSIDIYKTVYNTTRWRRLRRIRLNYEPLCRECKSKGITTAANEVDHIIPISEGGNAWSLDNLQSLCKRCHSRKTMNEINKRK